MAKGNREVDGTAGNNANDAGQLNRSETDRNLGNNNSGSTTPNQQTASEAEKVRSPDIDGGPETKTKRRGGWPKGRKRGTKAKEELGLDKPVNRPYTSDERNGVAQLWLMANNFAAMRYNARQFIINEQQAKTIGDPLSDILADWGIYLSGGDSPYMRFLIACIGVYGCATIATIMNARAERARDVTNQAQPPDAEMMNGVQPRPMDFSGDTVH